MSEPFQYNNQVNDISYFKMNRTHSKVEESYDPFSDLNLFLSRKIKTLIEDPNFSKKWSTKIERCLLANILPEFKQKFPKYELGVSALKKVWTKVSYYYEKIQKQKGVLDKNGSLNLIFLIRENLKYDRMPPSATPYSMAEDIALKLSECIASLEGKKVNWNHLAKMIWAVQKHLLKDLSVMEAKHPYEEYDFLDKLIVKIQLEVIAENKNLNLFSLKREVIKNLKNYTTIATLLEKDQLNSTLSLILADHLCSTSLINQSFSLEERTFIERFIHEQVKLGRSNGLFRKEEPPLELIQRILTLYKIAEELPRGLNEQSLIESIDKVKKFKNAKKNCFSSKIDPTLHLFINAQMHLMRSGKKFGKQEQKVLIHAYETACTLPKLSFFQFGQLELIIWKIIGKQESLLSHLSTEMFDLLHKELGSVLLDYPDQSFPFIINQTMQFLKKCFLFSIKKKKMEDKVEIWAIQNDMLIQTTHFDSKSPLLKLIESHWKEQDFKQKPIEHTAFIKEIEKKALKIFPLFAPFQKELRSRLWILYKYFWYHSSPNGVRSTYEKFLLWHRIFLKNKNPTWPEEKLEESLSKLSNQLIPFAPYKNFL